MDEIKRITNNIINNLKLMNYVYGEVISINPLSIKIDQKLVIPAGAILLTSPVIEKKINIQHTHQYTDSTGSGSSQNTTQSELPSLSEVIIVEGLKIGDKVLMLRADEGQKFIVLSKVV